MGEKSARNMHNLNKKRHKPDRKGKRLDGGLMPCYMVRQVLSLCGR